MTDDALDCCSLCCKKAQKNNFVTVLWVKFISSGFYSIKIRSLARLVLELAKEVQLFLFLKVTRMSALNLYVSPKYCHVSEKQAGQSIMILTNEWHNISLNLYIHPDYRYLLTASPNVTTYAYMENCSLKPNPTASGS